jgi:hypothetical protein
VSIDRPDERRMVRQRTSSGPFGTFGMRGAIGVATGTDPRVSEAALEIVDDRAGRKRRGWLIRIVPLILFAAVFGTFFGWQWFNRFVAPPTPLPAGSYGDLTLADVPRGRLSATSRFVFGGAPTGTGYGFAHPTAATVYSSRGKTVDRRAFEYALSVSTPMHVYVASTRPGEIDVIDVSP